MKLFPICLAGLFLYFFLTIFSGCQKSQIDKSADNKEIIYQTAVRLNNSSLIAGGVTLTAPTTVNVNETFNIIAEVNCGKIAIERGYILAQDGITRIYNNLNFATQGLLWEELVTYQCYTTDANWSGAVTSGGTYIYRTKHNASDGNCDGLGGNNQTGNCSFSGNQFYCFMIEAIACQTTFSGDATSCGAIRSAVYTFSAENDISYLKIQGGLTNFTGTDAVVTVSGGTDMVVSQWTPGGSTNRVIRVEGSVSGCETVTITVTWNSTNTGTIITGQWSAKDHNGIDLAEPVAGLSCE